MQNNRWSKKNWKWVNGSSYAQVKTCSFSNFALQEWQDFFWSAKNIFALLSNWWYQWHTFPSWIISLSSPPNPGWGWLAYRRKITCLFPNILWRPTFSLQFSTSLYWNIVPSVIQDMFQVLQHPFSCYIVIKLWKTQYS